MHLYGDDLALLKTKGDEIAAVLGSAPGGAEAKAEQTEGLPMMLIKLDREAIARHGLNIEAVLEVIEVVGGKRVGGVVEGQKRFDIQMRFQDSVRADLTQIRDLRASGAGGLTIPLSQLAQIDIEEGPAQISRDRISRHINIEANVRGRDLASFVAEAQPAVAKMPLPAGWTLEWSGQFENLAAASERLAILVPLALILILALLYTAFGTAPLAVLIFFNVPLAITGGLIALCPMPSTCASAG